MDLGARAWIGAMLAAVGVAGVARAQDPDARAPWKLSGSYLNLISRSRTVIEPTERFTLDLNRLRLRLQAEPIKDLTLDIQDDQELLLGSYLGTAQYALLEDRDGRWLDHSYVTDRDVVARHRLYRATISWAGPRTDVTVGRQRVALGNGWFWSPADLINPVEPIRLEWDYRAGIDGMRVEQRLGALGKLGGVAAPATRRSRAVFAAYGHGNRSGWDYTLLAGRFRLGDALGAEVSGQLGGLGLRGEATLTRPPGASTYGRVMLGVDYGFRNTLTVTAELYLNGQGASDPARYDLGAVLEGRAVNLARLYGGLAVSYQLTPLAKLSLYSVLNADDGSGVVWPRVTYSVVTDLDVGVGWQGFFGGAVTEYGRLSPLLHGEVRWFF